MTISKHVIRRIANLAALTLCEDEEKRLLEELSHILEWGRQLQDVNAESVIPTSTLAETVYLREDIPEECPPIEDILANAPSKKDNFFTVPKVVG